MSHKIINPSTSVAQHPAPQGYDYTIGPQQTLPDLPQSMGPSSASTFASTGISTTGPSAASAASSTNLASGPSVYSSSLHPLAHTQQVSLAAYAFLFQEMVAQARNASKSVAEIELRLHRHGYHLGVRLLELLNFRSSVNASSRSAFFKTSTAGPSSTSATVSSSAPSAQLHGYHSHGSGDAAGATAAAAAAAAADDGHALAHSISHMKRRDLTMVEILQFVHSTVWTYLFGRPSDDLVKSSDRDNEFMIVDHAPLLTRFISSTNVQCDFFVCGVVEGVLDSACFPCAVTVHSVPDDKFPEKAVFVVRFESAVLEREALRA
ncbi:LADA_0G07404g1_1 [Lachancea dasiensis]|uniref:LADA_0G07404g1_1 n=1 Tax=Lachancea dasiensis TaxID=1072105 RepID=A0A1G4JTX3_9SACH|nr:LADA_0G07404g1_1 [Lachancea dasiensis]